ncbi:MAG: tRNA (adenosine(37)-N6)-dimethylallyltransferase MiaA [bacterium]
MNENKPKIITVVGPTASGKSDIAVLIAKEINGEVISADSRQVYKGMDIGTGKVTEEEKGGVPHYLLDVEYPRNVFTVSDFKILAEKAIAQILTSEKTPIICGGTGLYVQAVIDDMSIPEVPPNKELRKELSKKTPEELFIILDKLDPRRSQNIDPKNPVRLIRAIEIAKALGVVPELKKDSNKFNILEIGLLPEMENLKERIKKRLLKRIDAGMFSEVEKLKKSGVSWKRLDELGLEYRYVAKYLQGELSKEEMIEKLNSEIVKYAKRQMTWFKKDKRIKWFKPEETEKILEQVTKFTK